MTTKVGCVYTIHIDEYCLLYHYAVCSSQNVTASPPLGPIPPFGRSLLSADSGVGTSASNPLFSYLNSSNYYLDAADSTFVSALPAATSYLNDASLSTQCLKDIANQVK